MCVSNNSDGKILEQLEKKKQVGAGVDHKITKLQMEKVIEIK